MDTIRWVVLLALTLFLVEGFTLLAFPVQIKQLISEADPRSLQWAGLAETCLVFVLIAAIVLAQ